MKRVRFGTRAGVRRTTLSALGLAFIAAAARAQTSADVPAGKPAARIDLATREGVDLVKGQWRYSDTKIIEVDFKAPGADSQPTGAAVRAYDFTPHGGGVEFDDSGWEAITPESLSARRTNGRMSFNWYRLKLTIPERVGTFDPAGSTAVFETAVDDYAEVWVDGELARGLGQSGGSVVKGWNAPNRLVVGRAVHPGQVIQLAVFGMNGPISNPVTNYIWMRQAKLDFYPGAKVPLALTPQEVNVEVQRLDPAIDDIVPPNPKLYKLAEGFQFTEGPIWIPAGYLLFSDPNANRIYKYQPDGKLSVFKEHAGYSGPRIEGHLQPGSNGLTLDKEGRLTINQHGNRRVVRVEKNGKETVLVDRFEGKRLNSPNDLVYKSDGSLYLTDPPFGLPQFYADPRRELDFFGVFRVVNGNVQAVVKDLKGPNGIAFSPDERYLYVGDWDPAHKAVTRYAVRTDGGLEPGELFFDMTNAPGEDAIDGIKVDQRGNLYVSGPGGLWVLSPQGKHLGTIVGPKHAHNFAWGDADGKTLYLCARSALYRMRLEIAGLRPAG